MGSVATEPGDATGLDEGHADDLLALRDGGLGVVVDVELCEEHVDRVLQAVLGAVVVADDGVVVLPKDDDTGRARQVDADRVRHEVRVAAGPAFVRRCPSTKEGSRAVSAYDEAFTNVEESVGVSPPTRWTVVNRPPLLLHDEEDAWAWRWMVRGPVGGDRPVIAGLNRSTHAEIEGGGVVTPRARRVYGTRGLSLVEENLNDPDLPGRRIIL